MDRINIDNLFPSAKQKGRSPLDVYSLYHPKEAQREEENQFSIENLIQFREDKKKKAVVHYERIYTMCLNRIAYVNNMSKTDMVYHIPLAIYRCPEYDANECLKILETRLRAQYLDTLILNQNSLFISWLNVAQNRKMAREERRRKDDDNWQAKNH